MRLVSSLFALAVLGCCFGPSVDAPPPEPAPASPSPLSQALQDMGAVAPAAVPPAAVPPAAVPPAAVPPADPVASAPPVDPATVPIAAPPAAPAAPATVPIAPPTPAAAPIPGSPACAEAQAAREAVRAELRDLRLTLGGATSARVEAAGAAMQACDRNIECLRDSKDRMARIEAYDRARAAHQAETDRLAQAEVGLYDADRRVAAACGAP